MQELPNLHRNFSSGAFIRGSVHPTEENILLLNYIDMHNYTAVTPGLLKRGRIHSVDCSFSQQLTCFQLRVHSSIELLKEAAPDQRCCRYGELEE